MNEEIRTPETGTIVKHTGWGKEDDKNYPCDVLIKSGHYKVNGRLSNFWYWQRILENGQLCETIEHGYGSFEKSDKNYKIEIKISEID